MKDKLHVGKVCEMCTWHSASAEAPSAVLIHRTEGLVDSFSQGLERSHAVSISVLNGIEPRLKDFHQLLLNPPKVKHHEPLLEPLETQ